MNVSKQASIPLYLCFWILAGCHAHHASRNLHAPDHATGAAGAEDTVATNSPVVIEDLDTSMLSLKAAPRVSLIDGMSQVWKMEDADPPHWNLVFWDSATDTRKYPELALFSDLSVTENPRCGIRMGKWQVDRERRELLLRFAGGVSKTYTIRQLAMKQMELGWKIGADEANIKISAEAIVHRTVAEDPYYPSNNQWRIRPNAPETDEQIARRVRGCVHFFALFFRDNHLRQETDISFSGLPSCFVWYNGGIGMQDKLDLDSKWVSCFYSGTQALKGYAMLAGLLESHTLKWPEHPTSWIKQTADVLDQMEGKL